MNYLKLFIFLFLVACGAHQQVPNSTDSGGNFNPNEKQNDPNTQTISYESKGTCSTGRQTFKGQNTGILLNETCTALKDQKLNKGCGVYQRETLFQALSCAGTWPMSSPTENKASVLLSYSFRDTNCTTGTHYFSAQEEVDARYMYCIALRDESLNQNCANASRASTYKRFDCRY